MISSEYIYLDWFVPPLVFAILLQVMLRIFKVGGVKLYLLGVLPFILNILGFALLFAFSYQFYPDKNAVKFAQLFNDNELTYLSYINGFLSYIAITDARVITDMVIWAQRLGFLILNVLLFYQFKPRVFSVPLTLKKRILITFTIEIVYFSFFIVFYVLSPNTFVFNSKENSYLIQIIFLVIVTFYFWFQIYWEKAAEELSIPVVLVLVVVSFSSFTIINLLFYDGNIISAITTVLVALNFGLIRWLWGVRGLIVMLIITTGYVALI